MLINYKRTMNSFIVEKPDRYPLYQMIKVNIISNGTNLTHVPPYRI